MASDLLDKGYTPHDVEKRWYQYWEDEQFFAAAEKSEHPGYSIVIPPPNVTGVLHMGHALNVTMQDILCRYRRLCGDNVLWMPGTDHAGIATQNVVEKQLAQEGKNRDQLGRDKFIETVWAWRRQSGGAIINQLKRLGASCDWKRERFTMDEGLSRAVRKVFVELYNQGLIYRGNYIINWCPRCHTALSDLEVEHEETDGFLYHIRYPFVDGSGGLVVATTRPETMFGDTAVAVNPDDERYLNLTEIEVILPLLNKKIPIIRDKYVGMSFGTGALKITPAHDPNDFEIGNRHGLASVKVIDDNGFMTEGAGDFKGLERYACRKAALKALKKEGLLAKTEAYQHGVGHCYRCKTAVEPNLSKQWFVKTKPLAEKAIASVKTGETRIVPKIWEATYYDWMENIRDWCISRQIWWGHRIPAWTCGACKKIMIEMETPEKCSACGSDDLMQDTDVLDTWFSSALWPFSTMGWPDKTPLLETFYPTSVLITGFDILFFWVARMMMFGLRFMGDTPFKDVYIHALVRDEQGMKMSKSKGNVIDPLTVIEEYGTDAFRFTLAAFAAQGRDIKMSEKRVEGYRHFVNKLWNASRFTLMHLQKKYELAPPEMLTPPDRWILSGLARVTATVADALDDYRFNEAANTLYQFVWHEFCDWYLEIIKPVLYDDSDEAQQNATKGVLWHVLKNLLVLLHPFMPFVTEEIWHKFPGTQGSIMQADFPSDLKKQKPDLKAEADMALIIGVITGIRNIRGEMNITPALKLKAVIRTENESARQTAAENQAIICNMAKLDGLEITASGDKPASTATAVFEDITIFVHLGGVINTDKEIARLKKELGKLEKEITGVSKKLNTRDFLDKAPEAVVTKVRDKYTALSEKHDRIQANLIKISEIEG
ncbi:valine--tRNA ligase [Desulfococcaceae bacterium HSG7]|nr:valine--tRNA ligase [Desulfococcaceae bacterium HSG7]